MKLFTPRDDPSQQKYKRGCLGLAIFALLVFIAFGIYAFNMRIDNQQGSVCTQRLADIDRALNTLVLEKQIKSDAEWQTAIGPAPHYPGLKSMIDARRVRLSQKDGEPVSKLVQADIDMYAKEVINSGDPNDDYTCPAGGTYIIPGTFNPQTHEPSEPQCSLAKTRRGYFQGTRLHSLQIVK